MSKDRKSVSFVNIIAEGNKYFSFVAMEYPNKIRIAYALINNLAECTHRQIFEESIQEHGFSPDIEPFGGGSINIRNCYYLPSILYGCVNENLERIIRYKAGNECQ